MTLAALTTAAVLVGLGVHLALQRSLVRIVLGLSLVSHGVNLLLVLSSTRTGPAPVLVDGVDPASVADPLPQAMVLTAIVIAFGTTALLLSIALRNHLVKGSDEVEDDAEDRRLAKNGEIRA